MKILIVNKFLYPNGGSETYIFEIGKQFVNAGHEVQYFGMDHKNRSVGNHVESYTTEMDFHTGKIQKLLYPVRIIYSLEARNKIKKVLEDFEPDIVHLNNFNFQLTPSIIYEIISYKKRRQKQVVIYYTAHDYQLICPNHMMIVPSTGEKCGRCLCGEFNNCSRFRCIHDSKIKSVLGSMEGYLYRYLKTYRYIETIICPSDFMKRKLDSNSLFKEKTITIHNFVNAKKYENKQKKDYVLYFGRYSEEKGIATLLKVCRELDDISFIFAGSGPLESEVNKVKNIQNMGFLRGDDLVKLISEARFSIYPSEWYENCPFSIMESIGYGTPVVGADIGGIPELVIDGSTGVLFNSGSSEDLREKIRMLWSQEKLLDKITENCKEKQFDTVEEYCNRLLYLYKRSLGGF